MQQVQEPVKYTDTPLDAFADVETFLAIFIVVQVAGVILMAALFIKVWAMTNRVSDIRNMVEEEFYEMVHVDRDKKSKKLGKKRKAKNEEVLKVI